MKRTVLAVAMGMAGVLNAEAAERGRLAAESGKPRQECNVIGRYGEVGAQQAMIEVRGTPGGYELALLDGGAVPAFHALREVDSEMLTEIRDMFPGAQCAYDVGGVLFIQLKKGSAIEDPNESRGRAKEVAQDGDAIIFGAAGFAAAAKRIRRLP